MIIMFDLHGVIADYPDLFKTFMKCLRTDDNKIIICSGPTLSRINMELDELGYEKHIHYDCVISVVDYLESTGVVFKYDENGNPWTSPKIWWKAKGQIANIHNVDLMIDDSEEYFEHIVGKTGFLLMKQQTNE